MEPTLDRICIVQVPEIRSHRLTISTSVMFGSGATLTT